MLDLQAPKAQASKEAKAAAATASSKGKKKVLLPMLLGLGLTASLCKQVLANAAGVCRSLGRCCC